MLSNTDVWAVPVHTLESLCDFLPQNLALILETSMSTEHTPSVPPPSLGVLSLGLSPNAAQQHIETSFMRQLQTQSWLPWLVVY